MCYRTVGLMVAILGLAGTAPAQGLGTRIHAMEDGELRLTMETRPGVYGDGEGITSFQHGRTPGYGMEPGPLRVSLRIHDGEVIRIRTRVGGSWDRERQNTVDLGEVPSEEGAAVLLDLAFTARGDVAENALTPAVLARNGAPWTRLVSLARDDTRPEGVRQQARFWLCQETTWALGLDDVENSPEDEVKEQAVFALSQRPARESLPALIRIAENHSIPGVRNAALFWLHQVDDTQSVDTYEALLREASPVR